MTNEEFEDIFYRCHYSKLLALLDEVTNPCPQLTLLRASTLFELHAVDAAKALLREMPPQEHDDQYLYAAGRLSYLDQRCDLATKYFERIVERTTNLRLQFKATLGLANCVWDESIGEDTQNAKALAGYVAELCAFEPLERVDDRIALAIFLGNYYLHSGSSTELARKYFKRALSTAAAAGWTYFMGRAIHGLAHVARVEGNHTELSYHLEMLRSFVEGSEQAAFSFVVNRDFANELTLRTAIEFDQVNKRVLLKDRWVAFHDKPMVYRFLELLRFQSDFVTKENIAVDLWPEEPYRPRIHDPRIFDIAKRARQMIETCEERPVVLLSGRSGYKLASN
jgi:tetratricopeptide (TPR) repeat protein